MFPFIWKSGTPPRLRDFMWAALWNKVFTVGNLQRHQKVIDNVGSLCLRSGEEVNHLFVLSPSHLDLFLSVV